MKSWCQILYFKLGTKSVNITSLYEPHRLYAGKLHLSCSESTKDTCVQLIQHICFIPIENRQLDRFTKGQVKQTNEDDEI